MTIARRALLGTAAAALAAPALGQAQPPIRLGVLSDFSSWGRDNSGVGSAEATRMAVAEFGPEVIGRRIEVLTADHQMRTDIGNNLARAWYDQGVQAIVDVPNSAIALAVHNLAREKNRIALFSGPGSSELTDGSCSPNTVHFTYDTYALSKVTTQALMAEGARSFFFITADYAFGHQMESDATRFIRERGGRTMGNVRHPPGTSDFSAFLLQAQSTRADVVLLANAGADTVTCLKQAAEFGLMRRGQKVAALLIFENEVHAVGLASAQGIYLTTASYWDVSDATRAWARQFLPKVGTMPTMIHTGCYGAVLHYLRAVRAAGTDDTGAVMAQMRATPINDIFVQNATLRADGRVVRDMYLARVKRPEQSREAWDELEILRTIPGAEAFRPVSESACQALK